jgi:2-polyprenyl-3-methyl-5-hydroxy-6-metoxy-1,4-benzoquinol methylase
MDRDDIKKYYSLEIEKDRLEHELFQLEGIRTKEIIGRYIQDKKLNIIDIGGGAGFYSFWLKEQGHNVSLIDLSPTNIELAKAYSDKNQIKLDRIEIGDAINLDSKENEFDVALLMGPLYHLIHKEDRLKALTEVKRILKPGGLVICAFISRYASLFDTFDRDLILDDRMERMMLNDLNKGVHINDTENPEYFTTAYFHVPAEMKSEITESGLNFKKLLAVESFGWIIKNFSNKRHNTNYMKRLLKTLNLIEENSDLMAMSPHILGIASKI